MSAEYSHRWQHRTHAAPTSHWGLSTDHKPHPGDVADCPACGPAQLNDAQEARDEA